MQNGLDIQRPCLPKVVLLSAMFLAVTPVHAAENAGDPLTQARTALYDQIEAGLKFFERSFGPAFLEQLRRSHREQKGRELEEFVREVCPVKQNAALTVKPDGTLDVVMPGKPDRRVQGGSPFKNRSDLMKLDSNDQLRQFKIDHIAGVLANGIKLYLVSSDKKSGNKVRGGFGQCMVYSFNEGQPLYALGYARALGEDGDSLWAELAGLLYASGRLTYRDFDAAEKYLELALKHGNDRSSINQVKTTLALIERYQKAGGENLVKEPAGPCGLAEVTARNASEPLDPKLMRRVWNTGEIVALVPLRHLLEKQTPQTEKAWEGASALVKIAQKKAGQPARGLASIPDFKGSKKVRAQKTVGFIFRQARVAEKALEKEMGPRAGALFMTSTAGHMLNALNRMGIPNVNRQLGDLLMRHGPDSGLPCEAWAGLAARADIKVKRDDLIAAWSRAEKSAEATFPKTR